MVIKLNKHKLKDEISIPRFLIILFIIIFILIIALIFIYQPNYDKANYDKAKIVSDIVKDYHSTHTYSSNDLFICGDMAIDVWNMVKSKGINAKIMIGNVHKNTSDPKEFNHAWVVAEVEPFKWVALDPTAGIVTIDKLYLQGITFDNPKEFKEYLSVKCPSNYMVIGDNCCLDMNDNKICDKDEEEEPEEENVVSDFTSDIVLVGSTSSESECVSLCYSKCQEENMDYRQHRHFYSTEYQKFVCQCDCSREEEENVVVQPPIEEEEENVVVQPPIT